MNFFVKRDTEITKIDSIFRKSKQVQDDSDSENGDVTDLNFGFLFTNNLRLLIYRGKRSNKLNNLFLISLQKIISSTYKTRLGIHKCLYLCTLDLTIEDSNTALIALSIISSIIKSDFTRYKIVALFESFSSDSKQETTLPDSLENTLI